MVSTPISASAAFTEKGTLINSGEFDGLDFEQPSMRSPRKLENSAKAASR
jgi:hypothetical protein